MTVAATMSVTPNYSIVQSSTLASAFAQTATATRIRQYEGATVSGIKCDAPFRYVDDALNSGGNIYLDAGTVVNIWARKSSGASSSGSLLSFPQSGFFALNYLDTTTVRLVTNYQEVNGWRWGSSSPADTNWHNYLILIRDQFDPGGGGILRRRAQLWVDGINRGIVNIGDTQAYELTSPLWFGKEFQPPFQSGNTSVDFVGDFAQIWIGKVASYTSFNPSLFYEGGYVELGTAGTLGGLLPTPYIYDAMDEPFDSAFTPTSPDTITAADVPLDAPDISARFALTALAQNILFVTANMPVSATMTASLTGVFLTNANLTSTAALTSGSRVNKPFSAALSSAFALGATPGSTILAQSTMSSVAALSAQGQVSIGAIVTMSSASSMLVVTGLLGSGSANLTTTSTVTVSAAKIKDVLMTVVSSATVSATAVKTARVTVNQASTATLNITATKIPGIGIDLASTFTLVANTRVLRTATANLASTFSQTAIGGQIKGTSAALQMSAFVITVGDVIQLDPALTYMVQSESRVYKIHKETRLYTIEPETRIYKLRGY
jgi:hypothetical protein